MQPEPTQVPLDRAIGDELSRLMGYNATQTKDWEAARSFLEDKPLYFKYESASKKTILHWAAYQQAPLEFIKWLLPKYPKAATLMNVHNQFPLHDSLERDNPLWDVVEYLLAAHPEAACKMNRNSQMPLVVAWHRHAPDNIMDLFSAQDQTTWHAILVKLALGLEFFYETTGVFSGVAYRESPQLDDRSPDSIHVKRGECFVPDHVNGNWLTLSTEEYGTKYLPIVDGENNKLFSKIFGRCKTSKKPDWEKVLALISKFPDAAMYKDSGGNSILHDVIREEGPIKVIELIVKSNEHILIDSNKEGLHPFEYAIKIKVDCEIVIFLLEKSTVLEDPLVQALKLSARLDLVHRLAISDDLGPALHSAVSNRNTDLDVVRFLNEKDPNARNMKNEKGFLPLHLALSNHASLDVIRYLLESHNDASCVCDTRGWLPLHIAVEKGMCVEILNELLKLNPKATEHRCTNGRYALQIALANEADLLTIECVLHNVAAQGKMDTMSGKLPLHWVANHKFHKENSLDIVRALLKAYPDAVHQLDRRDKTPLMIACAHGPDENNLELCQLLYSYTDKFFQHQGKTRKDVCSASKNKAVKYWIENLNTKLGRYKLDEPVSAIYTSSTCEIYFATDAVALRSRRSRLKTLSSFDSVDDDTAIYKVALKFLRHRDHFETEKHMHKLIASSKTSHVLELINSSDAIAAGMEGGVIAPSFAKTEENEYCVVMPAADRSLLGAMQAEFIAGKNVDEVVKIATHVAQGLAELHGLGIVHCDIKPRNVVRTGVKWMIIDLDAALNVSDLISKTKKHSSGFVPPEMARVLFNRIDVDCYAETSFDAWSFGALLFQLCTGMQLFAATEINSDNLLEDKDKKLLCEWNLRKAASIIDNAWKHTNATNDFDSAKNLVLQCLHSDPSMRPSMNHILQHVFLGGKDNNGYWAEIEGRKPKPLTTHQSIFCLTLGLYTFTFVLLHIWLHVLAVDTLDTFAKASKLNKFDKMVNDESSSLIFDFKDVNTFSESLVTWSENATAVVEAYGKLGKLNANDFNDWSFMLYCACFFSIIACIGMLWVRLARNYIPDGNPLPEYICCCIRLPVSLIDQWWSDVVKKYRPKFSYAIIGTKPMFALWSHLIGLIFLVLAYIYDNFNYFQNQLFVPLTGTMMPAVMARNTIKAFKIDHNSDWSKDIPQLLRLEDELEREIATVVGEAGEIGYLFQMIVTALFADGSPSIVLYFVWCIIHADASLKVLRWAPTQLKILGIYVARGMNDTLDTDGMIESAVDLIPVLFFVISNKMIQRFLTPIDGGGFVEIQSFVVMSLVCVGVVLICSGVLLGTFGKEKQSLYDAEIEKLKEETYEKKEKKDVSVDKLIDCHSSRLLVAAWWCKLFGLFFILGPLLFYNGNQIFVSVMVWFFISLYQSFDSLKELLVVFTFWTLATKFWILTTSWIFGRGQKKSHWKKLRQHVRTTKKFRMFKSSGTKEDNARKIREIRERIITTIGKKDK